MPGFDVEWVQQAGRDLENIIGYISQDNLNTALKLLKKIRTRCEALNRLPDRGRIVPELKAFGIFSYRELVITPWRVIYRMSDQKVYVLAVIESRRNIEDILSERFLD
ncbi:MAG TPA: type II toxin-antitoxin system RelE/ParE family toxin [Nitrospirae bacterium]|nr:type II toxin-antitoxin system RelE/ParE family toxin [Nitrospirota bacterium]